MSGFCPEGTGDCADAEAGPCVVGHPCALHPAEGERIENPPERVPWWDYTFEPPTLAPMPRSLLPCGCHVREPDYEAVLCAEHLAELNGATS